jgi:fructuronate reductase
MVPPGIGRPAYDPSTVGPGIVHLGLGAFVRGHVAVYTDDVVARRGGDWGIVGINLRSPDATEALGPQDGLYTEVTRGAEGDDLRVIGSLRVVTDVPRDPAAALARLVDPRIRIVSTTVTEKGYCVSSVTGRLDESNPDIAADLADPQRPRSVPGLLVEALKRRRAAGTAPFTVLSCDNLSHNGAKAAGVVRRFAELVDPAFAAFVADEVAFPSTMVDRITPATRDEDRIAVARRLGLWDAWPVVAEPFRQWVIEDRFTAGRPAWEEAGATLVADVAPFEVMKLRLLNGSHSTIAYLGVVLGLETVFDAFTDPDLGRFVERLWREDLVPTVPKVAGIDGTAYAAALGRRFSNPSIRHRTIQISADGSQKLPPRLLAPALERRRAGAEVGAIAFAVAAWMRFLTGTGENGSTHDVADPMAARLVAAAAGLRENPRAAAERLMAIGEVFDPAIAGDAPFREAVIAALGRIVAVGTRRALAEAAKG